MSADTPRLGIHTTAIHAGEAPDPTTGALVPPLHLATTYHLGSAEHGAAIFAGEQEAYVYSRWANPTVATFERKAAALEHGEAALATASGMAADLVGPPDGSRAATHIAAAKAIYPSTYHLIVTQLASLGIASTFVDAADPATIEGSDTTRHEVIYLETPGNPLLSLCDLDACSEIGRRRSITTICDNTFATPVNQRPSTTASTSSSTAPRSTFAGMADAVGGS